MLIPGSSVQDWGLGEHDNKFARPNIWFQHWKANRQIFGWGGEGGQGKGNFLTRPDIQYFDKTNSMPGSLYEKRVGEGVGYKKHMYKT